jgi:hypothetical protein
MANVFQEHAIISAAEAVRLFPGRGREITRIGIAMLEVRDAEGLTVTGFRFRHLHADLDAVAALRSLIGAEGDSFYGQNCAG